MITKKIGFLIIIGMCLQPFIINQQIAENYNIQSQKNTNIIPEKKITTNVNYKLEAYSDNSDYSLSEDIIISVALFNLDTKSFMVDTVLVSTPLSSKQYQLSGTINKVILDKSNFVEGINTITVSYKEQSIDITILRDKTRVNGNISTRFNINDILNSQPAPGVPNNISFSLSNSVYQVFPTDLNEYVKVQLNYNGFNLVLATKFYPYNMYVEKDKIDFTIPSFLPINSYNLNLSYSGDEFLKPTSSLVNISIHNFTPIINTSLSSAYLDTSNVLNETNNLAKVNIEGYLPTDLQIIITLQNSSIFTIATINITSYRNSIPIPVSEIIPANFYLLKLTFSSHSILNSPVTYTYPVEVVQKVQLIIRKDVQFVTLSQPVLFDFFCYDPNTFAGVYCNISMMDGSNKIFSSITFNGHMQKTLTFTNMNTAVPHTFRLLIKTQSTSNLFSNDIPYTLQFYHNSSVKVNIQQNIIDKKQLISLFADNSGKFLVLNENNLIIKRIDYNSKGTYANYFINLNSTRRGLNTVTFKFTPSNNNYSNVTLQKHIYVYDKITIQKVQNNASFYQLGSFILFQGVATLGNSKDSLNGVKVSLLLGNTIIANTTIQTNTFTFIEPTPNTTGLKKYSIAIYADDSKFIVTSDLYEITVSVINNFGIIYNTKDYQVGDTVTLTITGLVNRDYELYYTLNSSKMILKNFTYGQMFNFSLKVSKFGHYLIYLKEKTSGDLCYYALDVLQNPTVQLQPGDLKTFTHNKVNITISNYKGSGNIKIDNLEFENSTFNANGTKKISFDLYNVRPGNHSITLLFANQYTKDKVRTFFVTMYKKVELLNYTYSALRRPVQEGDTINLHLRFKEFTNESINDIPIAVITNEDTILAQSNIFNSASDLQLTVIGNNLTLVIKAVQDTFIHEEKIPLDIPVLKLISSDIQDSYSFDSATTLKINFFYKYFPTPANYTMQYQLVKDGILVNSSKTVGQYLALALQENGNFNLTIEASCSGCVNRTYQTSIIVKKLFDVSNTDLGTTIGILGALPVILGGLTVLNKKKSVK